VVLRHRLWRWGLERMFAGRPTEWTQVLPLVPMLKVRRRTTLTRPSPITQLWRWLAVWLPRTTVRFIKDRTRRLGDERWRTAVDVD